MNYLFDVSVFIETLNEIKLAEILYIYILSFFSKESNFSFIFLKNQNK